MRLNVGNLVKVVKSDSTTTGYTVGDIGRIILLRGKNHVDVRFLDKTFCIKNEWLEKISDDFKNPQPVDLSTVKVGEKYVIGEIEGDTCMYNLDGGTHEEGGVYKKGDVVTIVMDYDGQLSFSIDETDDISQVIDSIGKIALYPYTDEELDFTDEDLEEIHNQSQEPSEPLKEEHALILGVTPEGENCSTEDEYKPSEPTDENIKYARKYYDAHLKMVKVYMRQMNQFSGLLDEEDRINLLENSVWYVNDCVEDRICEVLGIKKMTPRIQDITTRIFFDSFENLDEFDMVIGKLRVEGVIK